MGIGDWGLGIGDWGLGLGASPKSSIADFQSPNPTPPKTNLFNTIKIYLIK